LDDRFYDALDWWESLQFARAAEEYAKRLVG
jgi:hypothetical protein